MRKVIVELCGNFSGIVTLLGHHTEEVACYGHEKAGGNALPRDIANAEVQPLVLDKKVIQVSSHLLGRSH